MTTLNDLACFMAYDIRGNVPEELNDDIAYRIGRAYADQFSPRDMVMGMDIRLESPALARALCRGLNDGGVDVIDIGLCGTEEVYFQTFHRQSGGGIMITASHNPKGYNGMKLVREGARPISGDSGLFALRDRVRSGNFSRSSTTGTVTTDPAKDDYIKHLLGYVDTSLLKPLRIVADPGNGGAGLIIKLLEKHLPFEFILINAEPDGTFPNGIPNPLLPGNRDATARAVIDHQADLGIAWDGDFDRCFLFDAQGRFIEGYYLVGLLAEVLLAKHPGSRIIHDPRLTWNTIEQVRKAGGIPVLSKTGHAFIKERMRSEDAVYGGEMSAHHYFRDFAYCDSGMIPWLLVTELISRSGRTLSELVDARMGAYPCSGEINYRVADIQAVLDRVLGYFAPQNPAIDRTDGISLEFSDWRLNLRGSNTEPLLRLNIETRGDAAKLQRAMTVLETLITTDSTIPSTRIS
jgi:phosphomannomutase / phosphoglucomutase